MSDDQTDVPLPAPILGLFRDADPEDSWSAGDSIEEQLRVIRRCIDFVIDRGELSEGERNRRLQSVNESVDFIRERLIRAVHELRGDN